MKDLIKGAALFVVVACLVWIAVLWHWRATQHDMDAGDIILYLAILPIVVFALVLAARWAIRGVLEKQPARRGRMAIAGGEVSPGSGPDAKQAKPTATWHLQAGWVHTAGGGSVDELLAAIEAGSPRPRPDFALRDDEGLPVMTARIADLDVAAIEAALQRSASALADPRVEANRAPLTSRSLRALASLSPLIDELIPALMSWPAQWNEPPVRQAVVAASTQATDNARRVRVLAAWPADWDDSHCAHAQAWLAERLCEPLADTWPRASWTISGQRMSGTELLSAAERTLDALQRQGRDDAVVLMACHSDLDAAGIARLERGQQLFHAERRPKMAMAGEGAAVLLLSALACPADTADNTGGVCFYSPAMVRRTGSIETAGRTSSEALVQLVDHSLASADLDGAAISKLASDADQHSARATELFATTLARLPDLDANEDLRLAGAITGRLDAVAPLLTLALAAAQVRASGQTCLALSLADTHWRMAAVLRVATVQAAPSSA